MPFVERGLRLDQPDHANNSFHDNVNKSVQAIGVSPSPHRSNRSPDGSSPHTSGRTLDALPRIETQTDQPSTKVSRTGHFARLRTAPSRDHGNTADLAAHIAALERLREGRARDCTSSRSTSVNPIPRCAPRMQIGRSGAAAGGDRLTAADIRADAEPRGLGRADPSQAGCGGDYGLRLLLVVAGWGEVVRSVPRTRAAVQSTKTFAWNPLNRPVPPENVSCPVHAVGSGGRWSTTWP